MVGNPDMESLRGYGRRQMVELWENLRHDNLWRRIIKNVVATTIVIILSLVHVPNSPFGKAAYVAAMTTVFAHPGRRFGQLVEALSLAVVGALLGTAWSTLGIYLGSLVLEHNPSTAYAIRALFLLTALLFHGFFRSHTPRLWTLLLLMIIVCLTGLTTTSTHVTTTFATQLLYPVLMAAGVILFANVCIFPEFSSSFLGKTAIETLDDIAKALTVSGQYFIRTENVTKQGAVNSRKSHLSLRETETVRILPDVPERLSVGDALRDSLRDIRFTEFQYRKSEAPTSIRENASNVVRSSSHQTRSIALGDLITLKAKLRSKLSKCQEAQSECQFEIAFSVLPPRYMRSISKQAMKKLVANTIAVIGACESRFALLGEVGTEMLRNDTLVGGSQDNNIGPRLRLKGSSTRGAKDSSDVDNARPSERDRVDYDGPNEINLDRIKPKREIEYGDVELLRYLLDRTAAPYKNLQATFMQTVDLVVICLAFAYDVPTLPSGAKTPGDISLEGLDRHLETIPRALREYDQESASALDGAAALQDSKNGNLDLMPREEVFLVSSFLLNFRQAMVHMSDIMRHSRHLVEKHKERHGRRRLYAPRINWRKWLFSGNQEAEALPASGRQDARRGALREYMDDELDTKVLETKAALLPREDQANMEEALSQVRGGSDAQEASYPSILKATMAGDSPSNSEIPLSLRIRGHLADIIEWMKDSEDLTYAVKLAFAIFLVTWPTFVPSLNTWYSLNRGIWASLQLIFVFEVAIGSSIMTFFLRAIGTTLGSLWGWAAYESLGGNPVVCAALIFIGLIPSVYVQLGTNYPKTGMVSIISMSVIALSSELNTVPGSGTENFLKRWIAFMIGGTVALLVEMIVLPVKARDRLVESLATAIRQISKMESSIAFGIEDGRNINGFPPEIFARFEKASNRAMTAFGAAETFLPFCSTEPRLKGSFTGLSPVYREVLFVLHQIVDKMNNMLQFRTAYGSGPLEEFNAQIYPYRRNIAGSITLGLFAVHEAFTTRLPLPHFLPSARLAHLRMINKVREVVERDLGSSNDHPDVSRQAQHRYVRRKYMSWNASSAAQAEIIEYLEELTDLTKLLVGANEFRSGLLRKPNYREYVDKIGKGSEVDSKEPIGADDKSSLSRLGLVRRRTRASTYRSSKEDDEEIPISLRRIQSRKSETGAQNQKPRER